MMNMGQTTPKPSKLVMVIAVIVFAFGGLLSFAYMQTWWQFKFGKTQHGYLKVASCTVSSSSVSKSGLGHKQGYCFGDFTADNAEPAIARPKGGLDVPYVPNEGDHVSAVLSAQGEIRADGFNGIRVSLTHILVLGGLLLATGGYLVYAVMQYRKK
jgi:hypothetical protein